MLGPLFLVTLTSIGLFALLVPSILISFSVGDRDLALQMTLLASVGSFVAIMIVVALQHRVRGVERELNFVALVLLWVTTPVIAAFCLMVLTELSFVPAWFEAVSAITTTGATVLNRDGLPTGILFWRASLEWYGGFLTLLSIIHVLAPAGFGGLRPSGRRRGTAGKKDGSWGVFSAYSAVFWQYGAATLIVALGLLFLNVAPSQAMMLAMISVATGGFLPFDGPLDEKIGGAAMLVMALGLCFGTLSVFWRRNVLRSPKRVFQENQEVVLILAVVAGLTLAYAARLLDASGYSGIDGIPRVLLEGFFTAVSLVSTSGIETRPGVIALLPVLAVLLVVFAGASVYSTAGGIKYYRIASMWIVAKAELERLIYPNVVSTSRFGGRSVSEEDMRAIWAYLILTLVCISTGTIIITFSAADFEGGLSMAITMFANAGPAYEALRPLEADLPGVASGWPPLSELPASAVLPAIALMTIGRLEVLIVFAVVNIQYWLKR